MVVVGEKKKPGSTGRLEIMGTAPRSRGFVWEGEGDWNGADKLCWVYAAMQMQLKGDLNISQILEGYKGVWNSPNRD